MDDSRNDEALMLGYRDGDARAFELLYERHRGALYRYLLRQCGIPAVAEELFQDVWFNLIRARERYEVRAKFSTYLFSLAHNRLIDYYRRQATGVPISYDDDPDDPMIDRVADARAANPEDETLKRERAARLMRSLGELPEAQREAFLLREEGGLSVDEIARATGVNMETAKSRLRYAVAKLKQALAE